MQVRIKPSTAPQWQVAGARTQVRSWPGPVLYHPAGLLRGLTRGLGQKVPFLSIFLSDLRTLPLPCGPGPSVSRGDAGLAGTCLQDGHTAHPEVFQGRDPAEIRGYGLRMGDVGWQPSAVAGWLCSPQAGCASEPPGKQGGDGPPPLGRRVAGKTESCWWMSEQL